MRENMTHSFSDIFLQYMVGVAMHPHTKGRV